MEEIQENITSDTETVNLMDGDKVVSTITIPRDRSTVKFPYLDLDAASELPLAIHSGYGLKCTVDQLAGATKHESVRSGQFMRKIAAAQTFGLIERDGDEVRLTQLGRNLVNDSFKAQAKAQAFLEVELYKKVFDQFKGGVLPADKGLENSMKDLGVAPKQVEVARQVFQKSATQAGFFGHGKDRLIAPAALTNGVQSGGKGEIQTDIIPDDVESRIAKLEMQLKQKDQELAEAQRGTTPNLPTLPPSITGLLFALPTNAAQSWVAKDVDNWVATLKTLIEFEFRERIKPG